jgi:O-antigen ligase
MNALPAGTGSFIDRFFPSAYPRIRWPAAEWIGLFALSMFIILGFIDASAARRAEQLLLLVSLFAAGTIRREDPDAWLYRVFFGFVALMLVANWLAIMHWGDRYHHMHYSLQYMKIFWFLLAGWWFGGREQSVFIIFSLAVASLFIALQIHGGDLSWQRLFGGQRVDFRINNAQHIGVLYGTVVLGLLAFMSRFFRADRPPLARLMMICLWLAVFVASSLVMLGSQTRQIWLGIAAAFAVVVFIFARHWMRAVTLRRLSTLALVLGAVVALGQSIDSFESMSARTSKEMAAIEAHPDETPMNSVTIRLILWKSALEAISERPWLGYGGAARQIVFSQADLPTTIRSHFGHFHNSYLELWLSYGVAAPLIFIGILGLLGWRLIAAFRRGLLAADFAIFGLGWLTFYAVVNLFESYIDYRTGTYLMFIVGGALYSITLPAQRARRIGQPAAAPSRPPRI